MLVMIVRAELIDRSDLIGAVLPGSLLTVIGLLASSGGWYHEFEKSSPIITMLGTGAVCSVLALGLIRFTDPTGLKTLCGLLPGGAIARRLLFPAKAA